MGSKTRGNSKIPNRLSLPVDGSFTFFDLFTNTTYKYGDEIYEEGSFTPTVSFDTPGDSSVVYTINEGG